MTADPTGILRLLEAPAEPEPAAARPLRLISALPAAHGRAARAEGLAGAGAGHELRLPGIGGRYLAGLAAHAHEQGWHAPEVAALLAAVEDGRGSLGELVSDPADARGTLAGLGELERLGLVRRGFAGRWERAA